MSNCNNNHTCKHASGQKKNFFEVALTFVKSLYSISDANNTKIKFSTKGPPEQYPK